MRVFTAPRVARHERWAWKFRLRSESPLCHFAFERGLCFSLRDLPYPSSDAPEIDALRQLGIDTAVPLLQEVDRTGAVLEGFLFLGPKLTRKPYTKGRRRVSRHSFEKDDSRSA